MEVKFFSGMVEEKHLCCPGCLQFVVKNPSLHYVTDCPGSRLSLASKRLYLSS